MKKLALTTILIFFAVASAIYGQKRSFATRSYVTGGHKPRLINFTEFSSGLGYYTFDRDYSKRFIGLTTIFGAGLAKNLTGGLGAGVSLYEDGTLFPPFC